MSKFINTQKKDTINSLVDSVKKRLNNPYYHNIDQKPTITTYYNQDIKKSTLDEGAKITYAHLGDNSSIKYNKINNFFIYGLDRINVNLEVNDFGLESDSIEGEAVILPDTITPYPNDYFSIKYTDKDILFKIVSVSFDTIENGSNLYKVQYKLDQTKDDNIQSQISEEFEFLVNNTGTVFNPIIRSSDYKTIEELEIIVERLIKYYKSLFFNSRVQAFTFYHNGNYFYDPYLVEFLIRNKVLDKDDDFLYITHQTVIPATFSIDYDTTFFRYVEINDRNKFTPKLSSQAKLIDNPLSILSSRLEDYFEIMYNYPPNTLRTTLNNFELELYNRIKLNKKYDTMNNNAYLNIMIKYFANEDITRDDINLLDRIDYNSNIHLFYNVPIIIYIINKQIEKLILKNQDID